MKRPASAPGVGDRYLQGQMKVFLLSPARSDGERASMLRRPGAGFPLARELRSPQGAELGALFAFSSALYFRGKLTYARTFADPPAGIPGVLVIAPGFGLAPPQTRVRLPELEAMGRVPVDEDVPAYAEPLRRDTKLLADALPEDVEVVLLGSVASTKYTSIFLEFLGPRLLFPMDFVGRGDMSRGGLLLRSARAGTELPYAPVQGTVVRGQRAAKLPRMSRGPSPRNGGRPR